MKRNIALMIEEAINLHDTFYQEVRFTKEERQFLYNHFERKEFRKNDCLLMQGETVRHFYFIESGILRYWTTDRQDREISLQFVFEGEFAGCNLWINKDQPSRYTIQAIQVTIVWRIPYKELTVFCSHSQNMHKAITQHFMILTNRQNNHIYCLLNFSPQVRYNYLLQEEKRILRSVPSKYIASYLGMTPQTLCRVRRCKNEF